MTDEQLQEFSRLTAAANEVVAQLRTIARTAVPATKLVGIVETLTQMQSTTTALTVWVQEELARTYLHTHPPRPRLPITSSELEPKATVRRFSMQGRPHQEARLAPAHLTGRWKQNTLGVPKPRRSTDDAQEDR